ncbi:MAG: hypothetical protein U9N87_00300 [Planctomycetota bacterium]|nr:hypothetical protein [Planctomycetota bacterium]
MRLRIILSCVAMLFAFGGAASGDNIIIDDTNFDRTEGAGLVADSYTNVSHTGLVYVGPADYLSGDATFELTFNPVAGGSGAALWFGTSQSAQWIFITEEGSTDKLRHWNGRNLDSHGGGTLTENQSEDFLTTNTEYRLVVDRTIGGSSISLDIELFKDATSLKTMSKTYTDTGSEEWGLTAYAGSSQIDLVKLEVTPVPEPGALVLLSAAALLGLVPTARRRRR